MKLSVEKKVIVGFAFALVMLSAIGAASYFSVMRLRDNAAQVHHAQEIITQLEAVLSTLTDAVTGTRGYTITGDESFLDPYHNALQSIDTELSRLHQLIVDPAQQERLAALAPLVAERLAISRKVVELRRNEGFEAAQRQILTGEGKQLHDQIRRLVDEMIGAEEVLREGRELRTRQTVTLTQVVVVMGSVLAFGFVGLALFVIRRDFTGRNQAEAEIRRLNESLEQRVAERTAELVTANEIILTSEARLQTIVENLAEGVVVSNLDGRLLHFNRAALEMHGFTSMDECLRRFPELVDTFELSAMDGIVMPVDQWPLARILRGEKLRDLEVCIRRIQTGWQRVFSYGGCLVHDVDGQPLMAIVTVRDITESKRVEEKLAAAEEHYRHLVNSSPSVVYASTVTSPHHCTFVSDTLTRMTGYAPRAMMDDPGFWPAHIHPEDFEQIRSKIDHLLAAGEGTLEYRFRFADGEYHWIRDAFRVIYDSYGKHNEVVGAWTDITDSRRTEEQLMQSQKMEAVGQLTGGVAHDFNNRLTVIMGNLEMLERKLGNDPDTAGLFKAALAAAIGAAELTRQLLTFSRRQVLEPVVININDLMTGMHDMLQRTLGETITIMVSTGPELWPVRADHHLLENVLLNLAVNARDAMPKGGRMTIEAHNVTLGDDYIKTHATAAPGEYVQLTVSDTGMGMSEEVRQRIFEPFFTTKEEGKGTGLGLAMVYGFVKQSGGLIEVYSEPGHGTSFKIYLPKDASAARTVATVRDTGDETNAAQGKTVLLVEDDEAVRAIAVALLTEVGCRILTANSGPAALKLFAEEPDIDLLFTDMVMPGGITGVELAAKLREHSPQLKVLYTSGYAPQAAADRRTIEHPHDYWLAKPYRAQTLRDILHRALISKPEHSH